MIRQAIEKVKDRAIAQVHKVRDRVQGRAPQPRSPHWPRIRKEFLASYPECAVCGGKKKLEVHHIKPFHLFPQLEEDKGNLVTLCEAKTNGMNCHLAVGHLGNFKSWNARVLAHASFWRNLLESRP